MIPYSSMWYHLISLDSIHILNTFSFSLNQVMSILRFILQWLVSYAGFPCLFSCSLPNTYNHFYHFPRGLHILLQSSSQLTVTSNFLVISRKEHILFQHNLTLAVAFQDFSNNNYFESVYITVRTSNSKYESHTIVFSHLSTK